MNDSNMPKTRRETSFGQRGTSFVDRFGVWLSKRAILSSLDRTTNLTVADLGCGYHAVLLRSISSMLCEGIGIDLAISKEAGLDPRLTLIEAPLEKAVPELADGKFDVVLFMSVLEHLSWPATALEHCHRILKPGGRLLLNVPTWRGKFFLEFSAFRLGTSPAGEMDDHKMYYDKRDLWPMLVRSGFKPSRIRMTYHKFGLNLFVVACKE